MVERSAGAIIFRIENGKPLYLLLHYTAGHWEFPKGHIEKGEKTEEAILREVAEETGLKDLIFTPGFKETIKYFLRREKKFVPKFVVFYLAQTKTTKIKISWEHQGFAWLSIEQAVKRATYKNAKEILKKADRFLRKAKFS